MIFFIIIFFCCTYSLAKSNQEIKVSIKTIFGNYPALKTNLQIPSFEGFNDKKIQEFISARIEKDIFEFLDNLSGESKKYLEKAKEAGWQTRKYNGETIFELHYLSEKVLSFSLIFYSYTLGAHGYTERVSYNFDLETGKEINIEDLFVNYAHYQELINQEIKKQILVEKEIYFNVGEDF